MSEVRDMPVTVNEQTYYRTAEVCRMVGISRATLFRWLKEGTCVDVEYRDRRGWRLFTEDGVDRLKAEASRISKLAQPGNMRESN
jgi:predicted site-specific integrase-resolvase